MITLKAAWRILRKSFTRLRRNDPLILASSTAFFTTFSVSPILVILVNILSLIFKNNEVTQKLFSRLRTTFGAETAQQIENIVNNFRSFDSHGMITVAGTLFLFFVATTLLLIVKKAIHLLWRIRRKPSARLQYTFKERTIAVVLILFIGILFLISLLFDTSVAVLHEYLQDLIPAIDAVLIRIINIIFSVLVVTTWFTILYKILPDARVTWNVALPGGLLTGILFNTGKWILGNLLLYSNMANLFGASAAFALILLFIFYASFILYFGASFTYVYAEAVNRPILPGKYSEQFEVTVINNEKE